jgi:hypothetical protein
MAFDGRLLGGISVLAAVAETGNFARAGATLAQLAQIRPSATGESMP